MVEAGLRRIRCCRPATSQVRHRAASSSSRRAPGLRATSKTKWTEPSWRVTGSYKFTDDCVLLPDRVARLQGRRLQRPDGTSGLMVPELTRPVDPEFATNYELGFKYAERQRPSCASIRRLLHEVRGRAARGQHHHGEERRAVPGDSVLQRGRGRSEGRGTRIPGAGHGQLPQCARRRRYLDAKYKSFIINQPGHRRPGERRRDSGVQPATSPACRCRVRRRTAAPIRHLHLGVGLGRRTATSPATCTTRTRTCSTSRRRAATYDAYLNAKTLLNASVGYTSEDGRWFVRGYGRNLGRALSHRVAVGGDAVDALAVGRAEQLRYRGRYEIRRR